MSQSTNQEVNSKLNPPPTTSPAKGSSLGASKIVDHGNDEFVEFYVGAGPREAQNEPKDSISKPLTARSTSSLHQRPGPKVKKIEQRHRDDLSGDEDESGWMDMEAANDENVYDEKGDLVADDRFKKDWNASEENFGYTRIAEEKQAEIYLKADKQTDFLFKSEKSSSQQDLIRGDEDETSDQDEDTFIDHEYSSEQIKSTKDMLQDSQKFAYVGLTSLIMVEMATELATITTVVTNKSSTSRFIKRMNMAQSSFGQWQRKVLERLYDHLELTNEEIEMIELLSKHGIQVEDLTRSLRTTKTVDKKEMESADVSSDLKSKERLEIDISWTILCDLFLILISDAVYDARSRALFVKFADYLQQDPLDVLQFERRITESLQLEDSGDQIWNEDKILKERAKRAKKKKYMYVGLATVGGSLVIGLSAGLLAPVIGAGLAAGLTTIGISGTGGFLAGAGGTALVSIGGTAIGARMGSSGMWKRVQDIKIFQFVPLHNNRRTNLIVTVSGWMSGKADDVRLPFSTVDPVMGDLFSLLWEPDMLKSTGQTINILANEALSQSIQQILGATLLTGLMGALNIPMMLSKLFYIVDNPWNVSLDRAWKAGLIMADTLISRNLGDRPITLLGFSLGSRVIYSCLLELAKRGAYGIVEKVIIFGSPFVISADQLVIARSVVAGDFINGYSKKDWVLGYLFRATSGGLGRVAGLSAIEDKFGIQNFDCTDHIEGHLSYRKHMPVLMSKLGFSVLSEEFTEIDDEPDPEETERQRKLIDEFDEAKKKMEEELKNGTKKTRNTGVWGRLFKSKKKEWWEMYSVKSNENSNEDLGKEVTGEITEPQDVFDVDALIKKAQNELNINGDQYSEGIEPKDSKEGHYQTGSKADNEYQIGKQFESIKLAEEEEEAEDMILSKVDDVQEEVEIQKVGMSHQNDSELKKEPSKPKRDDYDDEFPKEENITMSFA